MVDHPPAWLSSHLAPGETVRWTLDPDPRGWRRAIVSIALAAYLAFVIGFNAGDYAWWRFLPGVDRVTSTVPPIAISIVGIVAFGADATRKILHHRYTAYAVTDSRMLRVGLLGFMPTDAWPLADVRLIEREARRRGGDRVRVQVRDGRTGKRRARFRLRVPDGEALAALLPA